MTTQDAGCIIIADGNNKGGIGKTESAAEMAESLSKIGARVLVIGMDPQMNVESRFGRLILPKGFKTFYEIIIEEDENGSTAKIITEKMVRGCILETFYDPDGMTFFNPEKYANVEGRKPGPMLMPITGRADRADFVLRSNVSGWEKKLREALNLVKKDFDYIIIDCPPALGCLTTMAFVAADYVLCPLQPEKTSTEGMAKLIGFIYSITLEMNPGLKIAGVFFSFVQSTWTAHKKTMEKQRDPERRQNLTKIFGEKAEPLYIFDQVIRKNSALVNATEEGSLLVLQEPKSEYSYEYWYLLDELLQRIGGRAAVNVHTYVERLRSKSVVS